MKKYLVTGMSCAACQARVEKAVSGVSGVESCAVSLLTNSMGVEGSASDAEIIEAVVKAGYGASVVTEDVLDDKESPVLVKRLVSSIIVLTILMYYSMGHMMLGFPVIFPFLHDHVKLAILEMILAIIVLVINKKFFTSGFKALFKASPNMDSLVALGSFTSFAYSLAVLILMIQARSSGDMDRVMELAMDLYFESAAMIPTLITVGKLLEAKSKGRTTDALKSLMKLSPKEATVERNGETVTIPIEELKVGDIYILKAGDTIPVDGIIIEGQSTVNESALTGESIPVDKGVDDKVSSGTKNIDGFLRCKATRVGEDTTLSQVIRMVSDAAATKAPLARIADKVSAVFVPVVIGLAIITYVAWTVAGKDVGFSIARAISVLVISCPCALGLATPVAIMVGNGMGAKHGILYKTAEALENAGRLGVVVLDKTGTVTKGEPEVTDVIPAEGSTEEELLDAAISLEKLSEHPLAKAVVAYSEREGFGLHNFKTLPGAGVRGEDENGHVYEGGSENYIGAKLKELRVGQELTGGIREVLDSLTSQGKTPLLFISDNTYLGAIAVADVIKEDSAEAISELKNLGLCTVMLTGDNERTAKAVAAKAGVDHVIAEVKPDEKESVIKALAEQAKVAMVGDGINDAPALTRADTGFAIGSGTDVAVDAADVVLVKNSIRDVAAAIRMSRATIRNIHENLFWAFFYNALCIPLAMGLYGIALKPMYGAAAMALSSFCVCMNALRLNRVKPYDASHDSVPKSLKNLSINIEKITEEIQNKNSAEKVSDNIDKTTDNTNKTETENTNMKKTVKIEGMMCPHCEATVKKALEALDGIDLAEVSHEAGEAVITLSGEVSDEAITKAVEDKDYKVLSIEG